MIEMIDPKLLTDILVASLVVMLWSLVYKENVFSRVAENIAVGTTLGYTFFVGLNTLYSKTFIPLVTKWPYDLLLVTILGFMMLTRLIPKFVWPGRISVSVLAGITMAVAVQGAISSQIVLQLEYWGLG